MHLEEAGWGDIEARLAASNLASDDVDALGGYLTHRLVGHFGADTVMCSHGKSDSTRHAMAEVAAAALAHLASVLDAMPPSMLAQAIAAFDAPAPPPWDDRWRADPRTASWRS